MPRSTYRINGTDRTIYVTDEFAARFGGMTRVVDAPLEPTPAPIKGASRAKTPKTNSSKEGK